MIQYNTKLVGIEVSVVNKSHTSKCSVLDFKSIEHHDSYLGKRGFSIKGRNKKCNISNGESDYKHYGARWFYRSAAINPKTGKNYVIHSDVNASFNIGRITYPDLFNEFTLTRENMLLNPISVKI